MFEEKVAQNPAYAYNESNKQAWMEALRDYMIGRHWEMRDLLIWAENVSRKTIETADVRRLASEQTYMNDIGFDPVRASGDLWSFLNLNVGLTGNGRSKFKQAEKLKGLDVWRRIVAPMKPKTVSRKVELHTEVNSPPKCKGISSIIEHLDK